MNYIPDYNESKHNYLRKTVCYKQDLKHHTMPCKLSQGHLLNDFNTKKWVQVGKYKYGALGSDSSRHEKQSKGKVMGAIYV